MVWNGPRAISQEPRSRCCSTVLVAYGSIPRGGVIDVTLGKSRIRSQVHPGRQRPDDAPAAQFHGKQCGQCEEAIDAHAIQPILTVLLLAEEAGMVLSAVQTEISLVYTAVMAPPNKRLNRFVCCLRALLQR